MPLTAMPRYQRQLAGAGVVRPFRVGPHTWMQSCSEHIDHSLGLAGGQKFVELRIVRWLIE
jgi:hypothetical protein